MNIKNNGLIAFDYNFPVYNWFFPIQLKEKNSFKDQIGNYQLDLFKFTSIEETKNRSLYFHIPFCEDICSFCPFARKVKTVKKKLSTTFKR